MRKVAAIFSALVLCAFDLVAQIDSTKLKELDARLERYFSVLEAEPVQVKNHECDALIEAASDNDLRQRIALRVYDHYRKSSLMGDEAVAIHLIDKWFSSGEISMGSDKDLLDAKLFAEFNRQSLIGMRAPQAMLYNPYGESVTIPVIQGEAKDTRYQVLYFYDTDCAKCKLESPMLRSLLDDKNYPVDVTAVYVGRDEDRWKLWRESTFTVKSSAVRVFHLWDPEDSSGYQMMYGVTSTPKMFLIDPEGTIVGRGLDTDALERLLDICLAPKDYVYGGKESEELFDKLFSVYGMTVSPADVAEVASLLEGHSLSRGDTISFKRLEGDLLYYLVSKRGEGFKEGTSSFIKDYILSRADIWNTSDDSLKVVGMASMMDGLLSKAPVGARIPKTSIKGWNKMRRKGGYFFFSTEGCPVCAAEKEAADSLNLSFLGIDMTSLEGESPGLARKMLDFFDLSSLPYIIETGRRGVIKRRYISLVEHLLFLGEKD
ncbi:MAG: thioredoxin family protein [Bacteroidales bacterium]|nr:thioredoxin family protein [Bacteroidales bacterium]